MDRVIKKIREEFVNNSFSLSTVYETLNTRNNLLNNLLRQRIDINPDEDILKEIVYDPKIKVIFEGIISPGMELFLMVDVIASYCQYFGPDICLYIIGKPEEESDDYYNEVVTRIKDFHLQENIKFIEEASQEMIASYYIGADVFLCMAANDEAGYALLKAQLYELPIIAKKNDTLIDIIGHDQVVLENNIYEYAAAIHVIATNKKMKGYLSKVGLENFGSKFINGAANEKLPFSN